MDYSNITSILQDALLIVTKISAPILIISVLVGVFISILQAATQIHEQTLTFVPKLILIAITLLVAGPWMLTTLVDFTNEVFTLMLR